MEVLEKVEDFGDDLTDTTLIPVEDYCPIFPSNFAPSTGVIIAGKQLRVCTSNARVYLGTYQSSHTAQISERVLKEAEECELLREHPHPNLA